MRLLKVSEEFEGSVVIVSHGFRESKLFFLLILSFFIGLISQVAEELLEVPNKTIKNLTKHDISIVDYKKNLVRESKHYSTVTK